MGDYQGDCGRLLDINASDSVCCLGGRVIDTVNGPTCTRQSNSKPCTINKICDSNNCVKGICESKKLQNNRRAFGSSCTDNGIRSSNYCGPDDVCGIEPKYVL